MTEKMYKVISKESKSGLSRIGKPYVFNYLILDFNGKPARIQAPRDMDINVNDRVVLGLATKKGFGSRSRSYSRRSNERRMKMGIKVMIHGICWKELKREEEAK